MVIAWSLFFIAVATVMCCGWGWAFERMLRRQLQLSPITIALGMAAVILIGGILNLARLAYPAALAAVAAIGVLLAITAFTQNLNINRPPLLVAILIAAILIFTVATQLPPSIYNFHDDYQKYFAYPVRMVETGTVFGSPLSAMGIQTLGAQAFLDGFVVGFFPIVYINGVDAVFGLFLCLMLATRFTKNRAMMLLSVASVVVINPQYVNISTLFCGSALIMAAVELGDAPSLGLLYAALIAMKPVYMVFIAIHLLSIALTQGKWLRTIYAGLWTGLFLSPWILVHLPHYLAALHIHHPAPTAVSGAIDTTSFHPFSFKAIPYGSTAANYTLLVIAFALCGAMFSRRSRKLATCCLSGVAAFLVSIYVLGPVQYGYQHGLRYSVPILIGLAPAIFGLAASAAARPWIPMLLAAIPLGAFGPSFTSRMATELRTHSAASFAWLTHDPEYVTYNERILQGPERRFVRDLQQRVPAGETILVWINTPFYLDYRRNPIIDIDTAGVAVPWAALPRARYLIWDYDGFATEDQDEYQESALSAGAGVRRDARTTLDFIRELNLMALKGEILFDDGKVKIVRLIPFD